MKTIFGNEAPLPGNNAKVHPMDLVMQLGRTRRFNGSANPEWTVLHHVVLCAILHTRRFGSEGVHHPLFHDFHEYVTGDIPSPVKAAIGREHIEKLECHLDGRIYEAFGELLPDDVDHALVKCVDWAALFVEAHYIGLPGHVKHIVDTSILHLSPEARRDIYGTVEPFFPEVASAMRLAGFFEAPYEEKKA